MRRSSIFRKKNGGNPLGGSRLQKYMRARRRYGRLLVLTSATVVDGDKVKPIYAVNPVACGASHRSRIRRCAIPH